jgi:predicted transcriptional regulator
MQLHSVPIRLVSNLTKGVDHLAKGHTRTRFSSPKHWLSQFKYKMEVCDIGDI